MTRWPTSTIISLPSPEFEQLCIMSARDRKQPGFYAALHRASSADSLPPAKKSKLKPGPESAVHEVSFLLEGWALAKITTLLLYADWSRAESFVLCAQLRNLKCARASKYKTLKNSVITENTQKIVIKANWETYTPLKTQGESPLDTNTSRG